MDEQKNSQRTPKKLRVAGHLAVAIIFIGLMYLFNHLIEWQAMSITADWTKVLPYLNVGLGVGILAHLIFVFYDPRKFLSIVQIVIDIVSMIVLYQLYSIYPFQFEFFFKQAWLNTGFKIFLIIAMAITLISIVVRLIKKRK